MAKKKKNPSTITSQWKMENKSSNLGSEDVDPNQMSQAMPGTSVFALGIVHMKIKSTVEEGSLLPRLPIQGRSETIKQKLNTRPCDSLSVIKSHLTNGRHGGWSCCERFGGAVKSWADSWLSKNRGLGHESRGRHLGGKREHCGGQYWKMKRVPTAPGRTLPHKLPFQHLWFSDFHQTGEFCGRETQSKSCLLNWLINSHQNGLVKWLCICSALFERKWALKQIILLCC